MISDLVIDTKGMSKYHKNALDERLQARLLTK